MATDWRALSNLINDMWMYIEEDEEKRDYYEELAYRRIMILDELVCRFLTEV